MDSIAPELLEMKARLDAWRAQRKHIRQALPAELKNAILELSSRYSPSILRRVLKIDPWRLKRERTAAPSSRVSARRSATTAFFKLPEPTIPPTLSPASRTINDCRLQLERPDGTRLCLTLSALDLPIIQLFAAELLKGSNL